MASSLTNPVVVSMQSGRFTRIQRNKTHLSIEFFASTGSKSNETNRNKNHFVEKISYAQESDNYLTIYG